MKIKAPYVEPEDYIPKEVRKKLGLGEYDIDTGEDKPLQTEEVTADSTEEYGEE